MAILTGWKEIAQYLRLTVRTVQRWECLGLPVRRVSTSTWSPVVAMSDEIDQWARNRRRSKDIFNPLPQPLVWAKLSESSSELIGSRDETRQLVQQVRSLRLENKRLLRLVLSSLSQGAQIVDRLLSESETRKIS